MSRKGKIMYVPKIVITDLEDLMREDQIGMKSEGFTKMAKYARVGREVNRLKTFGYDWGKKRILPKIEEPSKKWKKVKVRKKGYEGLL